MLTLSNWQIFKSLSFDMQSGHACEKVSDLDFGGGQLINLFINGRLPKKKEKTGIERLPRLKKFSLLNNLEEEKKIVSNYIFRYKRSGANSVKNRTSPNI